MSNFSHFSTEITNLNEPKASWGSCVNSECLSGDDLLEQSTLSDFVGSQTVEYLETGCNCEAGSYGPFCSWPEPNKNDDNFCVNGRYNSDNFLSGCECRNDDNTATPYHGWYCEVHNRALCNKNIYKGRFYDVKAMDKNIVGDCCASVCKTCGEARPNCAECQQDDDTQCKFYFKKILKSFDLLMFS